MTDKAEKQDVLDDDPDQQIDDIADQFDEAWARQSRPDISEYVQRLPPPFRNDLARELIAIDIEYRTKNGETVFPDDYCFPPDLDVVVPADYISQLLAARKSPAEPDEKDSPFADSSRTVRRKIGRYKLLQKIGEGGMGVVWMAEQEEPVQRRVALKVIRNNSGSREMIARFEAERQALAMMNHQNIATVLDAGTTEEGNPYFVMELVKGIPITEYCDQNRLNIRERLELMIPIGDAIQHAHQKGIIHRDLKPSNVLVSLSNGRPVPKVIDFGLAKAIEHTTKLTDKTMFTEFGKVVGTVQYMSPEQAEMNELDVDTRSDIYSLGVILYELLTGSTPIDSQSIHDKALFNVLSMIREEDAPRPSTRLSSIGESISDVSEHRKLSPRQLQQMLRGELDWIVMKALDKDRTRRYDSASKFVEDLERYLKNEPVLARPPTMGYRLQKFYFKYKKTVISAFLVAASLVLGIIGTTYYLLKTIDAERRLQSLYDAAEVARKQAEEEAIRSQQFAIETEKQRATTQAVLDFLQQELLRPVNPWDRDQRLALSTVSGSDLTLGDLIRHASTTFNPETIDRRFPDQPQVQMAILGTIGDIYEGLNDWDQAIRFAQGVKAVSEKHYGPDDPRTLQSVTSLAFVYLAGHCQKEAVMAMIRVFEGLERKVNQEYEHPEESIDQYSAREVIDMVFERIKNRIDPGRYSLPKVTDDFEISFLARNVLILIPRIHQFSDRLQEMYGEGDLRSIYGQILVGFIQSGMTNHAKAQEIYERAFGLCSKIVEQGKMKPDDIEILGLKMVLVVTYEALEIESEKQLEYSREVYEAMRDKYGPDNPGTVNRLEYYASVLMDSGNPKQALPLSQLAVRSRAKRLPPEHPDLLSAKNSLALNYEKLDQPEKGIAILDEVLEYADRLSEYDRVIAVDNLVRMQCNTEKYAQSLARQNELIELCRKRYGLGSNNTFRAVKRYVNVLARLERTTEARNYLDKINSELEASTAANSEEFLPRYRRMMEELK